MAVPIGDAIGGFQNPPFRPTTQPLKHPSPLATPNEPWVEVLVSSCHFGLSVFLATLKELCLHPERNSGLVLRADPLPPKGVSEPEGITLGTNLVEEIHVRIMPKQPGRDPRLDQRCMFYSNNEDKGLVVYIPDIKSPDDAPFYYPPVQRIAFLWQADERDDEEGEIPIKGRLSISYLPWPPSVNIGVRKVKPRKRSPLAPPVEEVQETETIDADDRILRICTSLLERVFKFGFGTMVGYKKRVHHDVVVPRDSFQDLYLVLKDRHRHLDSRAPKPGSTKIEDVKRHVWKDLGLPDNPIPSDYSLWVTQDVAIAAFLMLLWKDMYPSREAEGEREWDKWGRPEGGFIDLGCGNGLLVHILTEEGYDGIGYELRKRRTWPLYPAKTQERLIEFPIDLPSWFPETVEQWDTWQSEYIRENTFIIGNHSDEITPWLPLLSLLPKTPVPHLSLPCCLHTLDAAFDKLVFNPPSHPHSPTGGLDQGLEPGQSRYKAYLMWLGYCGLMCGWLWEKEPLRVPTTKGWGIIARNRWTTPEEDRICREWALEQINQVRARGAFKVRIKEGKDH